MKAQTIQSLLQAEAEWEIPSAEVELWPAVRQRLLASKQFKIQKGDPMKEKSVSARRLRWAVALPVLALLLSAFTLVTPQGRALAQSIFRLFAPARSVSLPAPVSDATAPAATAIRPANLNIYATIAEAEQAIGFPLRELSTVPAGFTFTNVEVDAAQGLVSTIYTRNSEHLILVQSRGELATPPWGDVPADAIEKAVVGEYNAEYVAGMFVEYPNTNKLTWNPAAPLLRLRWSDGQTLYSLEKWGDPGAGDSLDKDAMIRLAEELMANP